MWLTHGRANIFTLSFLKIKVVDGCDCDSATDNRVRLVLFVLPWYSYTVTFSFISLSLEERRQTPWKSPTYFQEKPDQTNKHKWQIERFMHLHRQEVFAPKQAKISERTRNIYVVKWLNLLFLKFIQRFSFRWVKAPQKLQRFKVYTNQVYSNHKVNAGPTILMFHLNSSQLYTSSYTSFFSP